jgi:hypothetical protein
VTRKRGLKGRSAGDCQPEWEPLLDLAPEHVADFTWMAAEELSDGTRLQIYKHYWTRGYLHLDGDGRAFVFVEPDRYEEIEPAWVLARILGEHLADKDWLDFVRPHRPQPDKIRVDWTDSATKNGISRERSEHVVKHCGLRYKHRAPFGNGAPRPDEFRTLFLGVDMEGVELEVAAVGDDEYGEGFVVFHATVLRDEYRELLERGERWRQ